MNFVVTVLLLTVNMMTSTTTRATAVNPLNTATAITIIVTVELAGEEVVGGTETVTILVEVEYKGECSPAEDANERSIECGLEEDVVECVRGTETVTTLVGVSVCNPTEDGTEGIWLGVCAAECVGGTEIAVVLLEVVSKGSEFFTSAE